MGAKLVTLGKDSLDGGSVVVDVAPVLAVHEEGSLVAVLLELVKELVGVLKRTIVEGEGNVPVDSALLDLNTDGDGGGSSLDETSVGGKLEKRELHLEDIV